MLLGFFLYNQIVEPNGRYFYSFIAKWPSVSMHYIQSNL